VPSCRRAPAVQSSESSFTSLLSKSERREQNRVGHRLHQCTAMCLLGQMAQLTLLRERGLALHLLGPHATIEGIVQIPYLATIQRLVESPWQLREFREAGVLVLRPASSYRQVRHYTPLSLRLPLQSSLAPLRSCPVGGKARLQDSKLAWLSLVAFEEHCCGSQSTQRCCPRKAQR